MFKGCKKALTDTIISLQKLVVKFFPQNPGSISYPYKDACPYLNFKPAARVLTQRDYLSRKVDEMEKIMDLATEKIEELREENKVLKEEKESLKQKLNPTFRKKFKPKKEEEEKPKKKRGSPFGHRGTSRKRPKRIDKYVDIYPAKCDRCGAKDITIYESSFEEHIVEDVQVRVKNTCYRSHYGYCKRCRKVVYPEKETEIIPKSRIGPNARAISSYLRYIGIPFRKVAKTTKAPSLLEERPGKCPECEATRIWKNGTYQVKGERTSRSLLVKEKGIVQRFRCASCGINLYLVKKNQNDKEEKVEIHLEQAILTSEPLKNIFYLKENIINLQKVEISSNLGSFSQNGSLFRVILAEKLDILIEERKSFLPETCSKEILIQVRTLSLDNVQIKCGS